MTNKVKILTFLAEYLIGNYVPPKAQSCLLLKSCKTANSPMTAKKCLLQFEKLKFNKEEMRVQLS